MYKVLRMHILYLNIGYDEISTHGENFPCVLPLSFVI